MSTPTDSAAQNAQLMSVSKGSQTDVPETLLAAKWYAEQGFKIFPCNPVKTPKVKWSEEMTNDVGKITSWWHQWPDSMIGLVCGQVNGIVVLDIDVKNDVNGFESLKERNFKISTNTFRVNTPSGGSHFYFKLRENEIIKNSAGLIAPGVDVRGEGGYVIAPPSVCPAGQYKICEQSNWDQFMELVQ